MFAKGSSDSSFADLMSLEDAAKYNKFLSEGSIEGLTDIEIKAFSKVDDQLALGKVDYNEVLKLRREIASKGRAGTVDDIIEGSSEVVDDVRLIPGTEGVVTGGNSTKLGKNMLEDMGVTRGAKWTGNQAQHIIPAEMSEHTVLKKLVWIWMIHQMVYF